METHTKREPALYRDILRRVWRITWRWKFLLPVGFIAAFAANGEQYDVIAKNVDSITKLHQALASIPIAAGNNGLADFWPYFRHLLIAGSFLSTDQINALLLFVAVMIAPIVLAQAVIISTIKNAVREEGPVTFRAGMSDAGRFFLPILLIQVVSKVLVYGLLGIVSYPIFMNYLNQGGSQGALNGLAIAAFIILVPFQILVSFLAKFASAAVVVHGKGFWESIKDAWHTFTKHWLIALEMAFLLILVNIVVTLLVIGTLLTIFPPEGPFSTTVFFLVTFFVGSFLAVFQLGSWTMLYLQLQERAPVSKLARWAEIVQRSLGAPRTVA